MDTREVTREVRLTKWAGILRQRQESGRSIRAWCTENGIVEKTYHYWQRKLREVACEKLTEAQSRELAAPGFAEVRLAELPLPVSLPEPVGQLCVEFSGMRLSADSSYPPEQLVYLMRELRQP